MSRRAPALVVLAGLVVSLLLLDRGPADPSAPPFGRAAQAMPTAGDAGVLTSTWFCAAGSVSSEAGTDVAVAVANAGAEARRGSITWMTGSGAGQEVPIEVPARASVRVSAADVVTGDAVSAVVELDGGEVGVEHRIVTSEGAASAPCASSTSPTWHLANGSTARDATQDLVLFNPFPNAAVVDISLATDDGAVEPDALQGLPVEAGATEVVALHEVVRRRDVTALTVTARSGRLVVDRVQAFDGSEGRTGVSLLLATPAPATTWSFPHGGRSADVAERWHLYNPGDEESTASLVLVPDEPEPGEGLPQPAELVVPPRSVVTVDAEELGRLPPGAPHSSTVTVVDGGPIVVERSLDARPPGTTVGWTSALGAPVPARRWLLPYGGSSPALDQTVVVLNPGTGDVTASVVGLADGQVVALEGLAPVALGPGERRSIRLRSLLQRSPLPILVEADGPVVVERVIDLAAGAQRGLSSVMAVALADPAR